MLQTGSKIPAFELEDQHSKLRSSEEFLGSGKLVIFFYPMDFTPGCTKEVCSFRDQYDVFKTFRATLIGISSDSVRRHKGFATRHNVPYTLLSDPGGRVRKLFGLKGKMFGIIPDRTTFIIDENGLIVKVFDALFRYEDHVQEALLFLSESKDTR